MIKKMIPNKRDQALLELLVQKDNHLPLHEATWNNKQVKENPSQHGCAHYWSNNKDLCVSLWMISFSVYGQTSFSFAAQHNGEASQ